MQMEIKITLWNPTTDPDHFVADVYVDGQRAICGTGNRVQSFSSALMKASESLLLDKDLKKIVHQKLLDNGYELVSEAMRLYKKKTEPTSGTAP